MSSQHRIRVLLPATTHAHLTTTLEMQGDDLTDPAQVHKGVAIYLNRHGLLHGRGSSFALRQTPASTEGNREYEVLIRRANVRRIAPAHDRQRALSAKRMPREVARCRQHLALAARLLPAAVRQDALDEWIDEIECAAEAGKRIRGRALSIMLRTVPHAIWRAWRPAVVRRRSNS